jgi:RNA polymerase sigma-70 factor (ECF subfamily)
LIYLPHPTTPVEYFPGWAPAIVPTVGANQGQDAVETFVRSLYAEHGRSVLAYATRLTGDRAAAEDVVQETLVRAWKHADDLDQTKGSVRPVEVADVVDQPPVERDHSEAVVNTMVVLGALDQVSPEHREVLVELYYRGRSVAEAAKELGVPPGTVKSRTYYALRALRAVMARPEVTR